MRGHPATEIGTMNRISAAPDSLSQVSHDLHENRGPDPQNGRAFARPHNIRAALFKHYYAPRALGLWPGDFRARRRCGGRGSFARGNEFEIGCSGKG
jgi:hypothetical protein